jgi:hypothetical protein
MAPVGDLRYIADVKLNDLATPTAKAEIGAALAMLGDRVRSEKAFQAALGALPADPRFEGGRVDYGSPLRDAQPSRWPPKGAPKVIPVSGRSGSRRRDRVEKRRRRMPGSPLAARQAEYLSRE